MRWTAALVLFLWAGLALALDPSEMLADPELEARARALDHEIRCVKCQSEAIASSNAEWARDARRAVRELVAEGKTDAEVLDFFVARYGEVVRMQPTASGVNLILWIAGPAMLLVGIGAAFAVIRRRPDQSTGDLSPEDEERLAELLKD